MHPQYCCSKHKSKQQFISNFRLEVEVYLPVNIFQISLIDEGNISLNPCWDSSEKGQFRKKIV